MSQRLVRNAAKCLKCGDVIESRTVHDFRRCSCGAVFVDGGLAYTRHGFNSEASYEDRSEYVPVSSEGTETR